MGFKDHKQKVFNLVQALKALFLYTQGKKDGVDKYRRNFRSLWNTVGAFGGSSRVHKGLVEGLLRDPTCISNVKNVSKAEHTKAKEDACEAVKATLLISGADKCRYGSSKISLSKIIWWGLTYILTYLTRFYAFWGTMRQANQATPSGLTLMTQGWHSYSKLAKEAKDRVDMVEGPKRR